MYNGHQQIVTQQHENNNGITTIDIIGGISNDHINGTSNITNNNMSMPIMRSSLLTSHSGK